MNGKNYLVDNLSGINDGVGCDLFGRICFEFIVTQPDRFIS